MVARHLIVAEAERVEAGLQETLGRLDVFDPNSTSHLGGNVVKSPLTHAARHTAYVAALAEQVEKLTNKVAELENSKKSTKSKEKAKT